MKLKNRSFLTHDERKRRRARLNAGPPRSPRGQYVRNGSLQAQTQLRSASTMSLKLTNSAVERESKRK